MRGRAAKARPGKIEYGTGGNGTSAHLLGELFKRDYNVFLHYSVAALYFLVISLAVFWAFGLIYRRLMRHMPGAVPMRFSFRRILR